jgi:hypothetical protein
MNARFLEIEAWTVPCSLVHSGSEDLEDSEQPKPQGICLSLPANETEEFLAPISLSSPKDREDVVSGAFSKPCLALIIPTRLMPTRYGGLNKTDLRIMIVGQNGDFWERVGHLKLDQLLCSLYDDQERRVIGDEGDSERWFHSVPKTKRRIRLG